jgi:uroporphyrin-III C-methyltransferase/precorrin-2 dehydrogenase/sirohydrochlorin ferrochelatase
MQYFPVFMDLQDQAVAVVGAGSVAERKVRQLLKAGAVIKVVARDMNDQFRVWANNGQVSHVASEYQIEILHDARLVFAATSDDELNKRVFADAESLRLPVNVVDDSELCRFISPATIDRSPIQVAISTGGSSPVMARRIRAKIETILPRGIGRVAKATGALRQRVKEKILPSARRQFWEEVLTDKQISFWSGQETSKIKSELRREINRAAQSKDNTPSGPGHVYLVGAGPGRADLLTLRAHQVLGIADVILHDGLVSPEVLDVARRDADRIYVGKRAGSSANKRKSWTQHAIQKLIVEECEKGRVVVRLKGGDSFVFGRGGEELEYLQQKGIDYEVVPGITAATGAAAFSGIPLTHRDHSQVLTFVTGHRAGSNPDTPAAEDTNIDWAGIAGEGRTTVIYMGVRQSEAIRQQLLQAGISADLPSALVVDATLDSQTVIHGTVGSLPDMAKQVAHGRPGLLIIGQVTSLGSNLAWFKANADLNPAELKSAA